MSPADELTLHLIASGLLEIIGQLERGGRLFAPYPAKLQRGLDRFALARFRQKQAFPESMVDLFAWCRRPLAEWGFGAEGEYSWGPNDSLLDGEFVTALCEDWARTEADIEANLTEERLMKRTFDLCQSVGTPQTYTALRQLWIEQPILTALEFQQKRFEPLFAPVVDLLDETYMPVQPNNIVNGQIACCPICQNVLRPTTDRKLLCENERCRAKPRKTGRVLAEKDEPVWLVRALRRFVCAPGLAEVRLARKLQTLGLEVELWPAYDAYDLRVTFPGGKVWAIDVKDWADPMLLARKVKPFAAHPAWDEAFFVFPDDKKVERPNYLELFSRHAGGLSAKVRVKFEGDMVRLAKRQIKEQP